jgi:hypothetical protein
MAASGKSKIEKSSSPTFVKGGSGKMFGAQHAGLKTPGVFGPACIFGNILPEPPFAKEGVDVFSILDLPLAAMI